MTHLFTLGFGGSVVTGALCQLVPVMLHSRLHSERLATLQLWIHGAGVAAMVTGFLRFETRLTVAGGTLVVAGAVLFVWNLWRTLRQAEQWNRHGYLMAAAMLFYLATLCWGLVLALNQRYGFLGEVEGAPLAAHLAMGLVGWFSLMIVAVGLKLVPMFAPGKALPDSLVALVGGGLAAGVLLFVAGLPLRPGWLWPGVILMAVSGFGYAGAIGYACLHRRRGPLDFSVRFSVTAGGVLALIIVAAVAGLGGLWSHREFQAGLAVLFAGAWIGGTILGMLLRIIPFMVWLHRFRNRLSKQEKIPFLHEMFHPVLGRIAYLSWFPGVVLVAAGITFGLAPVIVAGAVACLMGVGAFALAVGQVLRHIPPGTPALYPGGAGRPSS